MPLPCSMEALLLAAHSPQPALARDSAPQVLPHTRQLQGMISKVPGWYKAGFSEIPHRVAPVHKAPPNVRADANKRTCFVPDATMVLAHSVFSMLRLS